VKNKLLLFSLFISLIVFICTFFSCKKINEYTDLGDDLIPGVDNITTFDTTVEVNAFNQLFSSADDSLYIGTGDVHFLGNIKNDPLFGKTNAMLFLELKPQTYPWKFANYPDSILSIDSVVLVLAYTGTYGDTTEPQTITVKEIPNIAANDFRADSFYLVRQQPFNLTGATVLGSATVIPSALNDSVKVFGDTTANQLRIKLDNSFGQRLLDYDTATAYRSDSLFKTRLKGFVLEVDSNAASGNALMGFDLLDNPNTKLAIYYRFTKNGSADTTVDYFRFTGASAHHNYISRKFAGTKLDATKGDNTTDSLIYLINTPGSYAKLNFPALATLSNRLIHRAELIIEQVYHPSDAIFGPPETLWLDAFDSSISAYKTMPFDASDVSGSLNPRLFGVYGKKGVDGSGNPVVRWSFNISRYTQALITGKEKLYDFRLVSHRYLINRIRTSSATNTGDFTPFSLHPYLNTTIATGRVQVGGTGHSAQRMRIRIIYSKI